jgi:hypothetical protein
MQAAAIFDYLDLLVGRSPGHSLSSIERKGG